MSKISQTLDYHSDYLASIVADMKFVDKQDLKNFFKANLNLFYSNCLENDFFDDIDVRIDFLLQENEKMSIERVSLHEQILRAKSALRERQVIDTKWLARINYAYEIKGVSMQNNNQEISRLKHFRKLQNIKKANTTDRIQLEVMKSVYVEKYGADGFMKFIEEVNNVLNYKLQEN